MLRSPKALLILAAAVVIFVIALLGGALGEAFGFGFLGAPLAAIQIPAEPVLADPIIGSFKVTNTMVATWITIVVLLLIALKVRSGLSDVPGRFQGLVEVILEFFLSLAESIAGRERARIFFPLVMSIFLFIFVANWLGILPGFGTVGRIETAEEVAHHHCDDYKADAAKYEDCLEHTQVQVFEGDGAFGFLAPGSIGSDVSVKEWEEHPQPGKRAGILVPWFRSANTDLNTTLAIAIVAMVMIHFWAFRTLGVFGHVGKFINFKQGPIGFFVGILELISEVARLISFTFRLFGNIFAGEVLLAAMIFLVPLIGIIPFLGLELFVGLIQAFIFSMLTLVFAAAATVAHNGDHH